MEKCKEVSVGILRLVEALENEGNATSQARGSPALCFACGTLKGSGEVKLLSQEKLVVLLRALLVSPKDEEEILRRMKDPVNVCGGCDKSLESLVDLNQQIEDARLEFCGVRRRVGRKMILGSLGRFQETQKSYGDWLTDLKSVDNVFPSEASKRLRRSKSVGVGTDAVAPGSTGKDACEKDVSRPSIKSCHVMLKRIGEVSATPRKRPRSAEESEIKKPSSEQRTKRVAGNSEGSADEEESPEQGTPKQDGTRVGGGSYDLPSTTERPRRAVAMTKRSSHADGSLKGRSKFTRKPLTMWRPVRVTNKTGGKYFYRRCKFCPKVCSNYYFMRHHCYVAHKTKYMKDLRFVCRVCFKLFPARNTLEDHKKEHESLRCPTCNKYFPFQENLKVHMRNHTGEKPYACDVCNQKFTFKQQAQAHMATHTGVKPFACSCGQAYNWKQSLSRHKAATGHS